MSVLDRMLARAGITGAPGVAAATPRLPSWFEQPRDESPEAPVLPDPAAGGSSTPQVPGRRPPAPLTDETRTAGAPAAGSAGLPSPAAPAPSAPAAARSAAQPVPATGPSLRQRPAPPGDDAREPGAPTRDAVVGARGAAERPVAAPSAAAIPVAEPPVAEPPVAAVPRPAAAAAPIDAVRELADAGGGPDVVDVAIGRIEVRATLLREPTAAGPVERPAPAQPVLSLADYLAGKRGAR